jgi:hypothetical protein
MAREISASELADLSTDWNNPTVDTSKYYQCVLQAWEVDQKIFDAHNREGGLCQIQNGRFYIA